MIARLYRWIEGIWKAILAHSIGEIFHVPVEFTHNDCVVCHWWRGAVLFFGIGLALGGHWLIGAVCIALVLAIVWMQRIADKEGS